MSNEVVINVKGNDYIVWPPTVGHHSVKAEVGRKTAGYQITFTYRSTRNGKGFGPLRWVGSINPGKGVGAELFAKATEEFGMDSTAYLHMIAEYAADIARNGQR